MLTSDAQFGALPRCLGQFVQVVKELFNRAAGTILQHEGEAAGCAQSWDRGWAQPAASPSCCRIVPAARLNSSLTTWTN